MAMPLAEPESKAEPETIGAFLRQERKARGLNRTALGRQAGVSRATIYNYENGAHAPSRQTLERLQPILGFDWREIELRGPDSPPQLVHPRLSPAVKAACSRLRELRVQRRLSTVALSKLAGISRMTINSYEGGRRLPRARTLERLQPILQFDWDDIAALSGADVDDLPPRPPADTQRLRPDRELANAVITRADIQVLLGAEIAYRPLTYPEALAVLRRQIKARLQAET
jgi:transcriptional regulator with XRE-family HTH domain